MPILFFCLYSPWYGLQFPADRTREHQDVLETGDSLCGCLIAAIYTRLPDLSVNAFPFSLTGFSHKLLVCWQRRRSKCKVKPKQGPSTEKRAINMILYHERKHICGWEIERNGLVCKGRACTPCENKTLNTSQEISPRMLFFLDKNRASVL